MWLLESDGAFEGENCRTIATASSTLTLRQVDGCGSGRARRISSVGLQQNV